MKAFWLEMRKDKLLAVVCAILFWGAIHEALNLGALIYGYPNIAVYGDISEQVKAHRAALLQECRNQCPKPKENRFKRLFKALKKPFNRPARNRSQVK